MKRLLTAGIFGTILGIVSASTANASIVSSGFLDEKLTEMTNATTLQLDNKANQKDLTALSNKIGTLPDDITVQAMLEGWTDSSGDPFPGLFPISLGERNVIDSYDGHGTARLLINGAKATTIDGVDYTGPVYPLWKLSEGIDKIDSIETKIGTLPSGNFPIFPYSKQMFDIINFEYPQNLSQLIYALFGNTETNTHGAFSYLMNDIIGNVPFGGNNISEIIGEPIQTGRYTIPIYELIYWGTNNSTYLLPNMNGTFSDAPLLGLYELSNRIDKIGTVPEGKNLAGMISETDAKIGTVPDGKNLAGMIGTLPDGYDSVGAALTAIKGIAEDAKAAALAAIPDPKQEGSSGKFVLTVDIVGDNATYRWEKIDREGETTTTTE